VVYSASDGDQPGVQMNLFRFVQSIGVQEGFAKRWGQNPYSFYTPYHLCHFEVPLSAARAVIFGDAVMAPAGAPRVEVVATAKVDLAEGTEIDAMGGYLTYGQCEVADTVATERLLPIGVAEGCRVVRAVEKDALLTYDDVEVPPGRLHDELRREQAAHFA
jgi:predicted homoserine dehydrogenase-like protein